MTELIDARPATSYVGERVKRIEDPKLLTGRGRYVADIDRPGMLHAALLRSGFPHAAIRSIDTSEALALPGVEAVLTAADLRRLGISDMPVTWVQPNQKGLSYPLLASDRVRFVGEQVAVVAAESRYVAEDALDLIQVEYDELPAVLGPDDSLAEGATLIHPDWGDNVIVEIDVDSGDYDEAAREADVVLAERLRSHRYMAVPLETRGAVAEFDPATETLTVWISNQSPHRVKTHLAKMLGWPEHKLRVIVPEVGGGFGLKDHIYAEEVLAAVLTKVTGRPVKWVEDRREHFLGSVHAREQLHDIELAARADGTLLGVRDRIVVDHGAYTANIGIGPSATTMAILPGPYRFSNYRCNVTAAATNKVPSGAYRGFGQPQATFVMERMFDRLARRLELDPAELRLRNFIRPEEFPYTTPTGLIYDSGDYPEALRKALELVDYDGWRARQRELREQGRHVGIGMAAYIELTGLGPSKDLAYVGFGLGGYESVVVRMDPQGRATVYTAMANTGQSHHTTLAQLCATELGIRLEDVVVVQGDTDVTPYAPAGSIGSRGAAVGGPAVMRASRKVRIKLLQMAAHLLEASEGDLEIADGNVFVRGTPSSSVPVAKVAHEILLAHDLPEAMEPSLEEKDVYDPHELSFAYAMHVGVVEVDAETGVLEILKYAVVHDCGTVINPNVVEGQVVGGVAQGIGGALLEELVYDESGQLLTSSFMDYLLPSAAEVPPVLLGHLEIPAPHVPGGFKGAGEGGTIAPPGVLANAVEDALSPFGVFVQETPLSPGNVWNLVARRRGLTSEEVAR